MGRHRPDKSNAFTMAMLAELAQASALLETGDDLHAGVLLGHAQHFTAGLDMVDVAPPAGLR